MANLAYLLSKYYPQKKEMLPVWEAMIQRVCPEIGAKRNLPELNHGSFASIYWLPNRTRILKLTGDDTDAKASMVMKKKPDRSIVKTYDVFKFPKKRLWGIVNEKLTELDPTTKENFLLLENAMTLLDLSRVIEGTKEVQEFRQRLLHPTTKREIAVVQQLQEQQDIGVIEKYLDIYGNWGKVLEARQIAWYDFKVANLMMRGHEVVISDIGVSDAPAQTIPELQVDWTFSPQSSQK